MEILVLGFGALCCGGILGGLLARFASPRAAMIGGLVLAVAAAVSLVIGSGLQGWDGMGYTIVGALLLAPMALAATAVGALAWFGRRRARAAARRATDPERR
ncbi:hypothetical protein [Pararhodobacter zhoushanensis]|uniref:GlsB/YeaQ/YmgE family stress response membrane protein n=1 Tax=Pararhodobacter zhoushanensis TaxID=2479545 RepID=A0ABT3H2E1_9RHOB|nr:hypothetical protein [Pararhodobacter zhoushanensis]MCW1404362.1 hypothetical protein [Novosphingobium sp. MW5]MCW1933954.1 hypothetical protein [Pararhodobacter zhoushanensis]